MDKSLDLLIAVDEAEKKLTAIAKKLADLDLLLEAEELFEAKYARLWKAEDSILEFNSDYKPIRFQVYICNEFNYGNTREGLEKAHRFMQLIKESMTARETRRFINAPFNLDLYPSSPGDLDSYSLINEEQNFHRAIWLDFMILVLEDEVLELMGDESLPEEVPGVPGVPKDMTVPKGLS